MVRKFANSVIVALPRMIAPALRSLRATNASDFGNDPLNASEGVEGNVQDVVGFMIGKMYLKEMKIGVDVADQAYPVR